MERRGFLKRLFGAGVGIAAMATVPGIAKTREKETFKLEDIEVWCNISIKVRKGRILHNKHVSSKEP